MRQFPYSSLSRMTYSQNPETTWESYVYDENGNLKQREGNRGVYTTCLYNGPDDLSAKQYSDSTPWPSYSWNRGWLTETYVGGTGNTAFVYGNFDGLGRPQSFPQTTNINGTNEHFPFTVGYAVSDGIASVTTCG